ncbi:MAG: PQQ-binding-like beta-propeller repeat protein, partial [Kiritimatiellae bacterium]|nr:PQQ-binding-like beta-propeller repeat protein [Kiritimatiellia bacterium]
NIEDGKQLWTGAVAGKVYGLAVSDNHLYVSTDKGIIHCFETDPAPVRRDQVVDVPDVVIKPSPYPSDEKTKLCAQAAETALKLAGVKKGYCLVLGANTGRLAYEIARQSQMQIIGIEPDASKVSTARKLLAEAGLYGARISIHEGDLNKLPYQKNFANLIVSEETLFTGKLPTPAAEVYRVLRPCNGTVMLMIPQKTDVSNLIDWGLDSIPGWKTGKTAGNTVGFAHRGPLPGAGEWSYFHADPGNTACSGDALSQGEVDIQWFGRPGPRRMPDRHDKNVGPLYKNGRLFVSGDNYVVVIDAYNGTLLWERNVPDSVRLGAFKHSGNMVAADDQLYVASGSDCIAFDAQTGQHRLTLSVPANDDGSIGEWGYIAMVDNLLVGSITKPGAAFREQTIDTEILIWRDLMPVVCSDSMFAYKRHSEKKLWSYTPQRGVIINPTIAIGNGRIYFVESTNPETRNIADGRIKLPMLLGQGADLVSLSLSSGKILWRKPAELQAIQNMIFLSYAKEKLVITGTKNVPFDKVKKVRYDLAAFDAATGKQLWQNTQTPVPDHILQGPHGEQVQHSAIVGDVIYNTGFACNLHTGEPVTGWKWQKSGSCGVLSTSANCAFSRFNSARMFDLKTGEYTDLTGVVRPGCWINIIPAGGLILMPEASAGCICGYSIQTSIALTPGNGRPTATREVQ